MPGSTLSLNLGILLSSVKVIKAAVAQVKAISQGAVSEADISRAKSVNLPIQVLFCFFVLDTSLLSWGLFFLHRTQVKTEYLMSIESSDSLLEEIGAQALITASYQPPDSVLQAVDAVALNDVVQVCACNKGLKISAQVNRAQRMMFTH